jgi:hypothetical protein
MRWTVAQAVTWIAFGEAQPIGNWDIFTHPSREWPVQPANGLLEPLGALARGASTRGAFDPEHWAQAKSLTLNEKPDVLLRDLEKDLEEERTVGEKIGAAGQQLWHSVREGALDVYAVPEGTPFVQREKVDPDLIARFPLALHLDGRIAPARPGSRYHGPTFVDAAFEPDHVRKLWPPAPPAKAKQWMFDQARAHFDRNGTPAKRDDLVKRCAEATGCTHREAADAYKTLPPGLRRSRGKRGNPTSK